MICHIYKTAEITKKSNLQLNFWFSGLATVATAFAILPFMCTDSVNSWKGRSWNQGFVCQCVACASSYALVCMRACVCKTECESVDGGRFERACFLCTDKPLS